MFEKGCFNDLPHIKTQQWGNSNMCSRHCLMTEILQLCEDLVVLPVGC